MPRKVSTDQPVNNFILLLFWKQKKTTKIANFKNEDFALHLLIAETRARFATNPCFQLSQLKISSFFTKGSDIIMLSLRGITTTLQGI